jgi:hypothetical protein
MASGKYGQRCILGWFYLSTDHQPNALQSRQKQLYAAKAKTFGLYSSKVLGSFRFFFFAAMSKGFRSIPKELLLVFAARSKQRKG